MGLLLPTYLSDYIPTRTLRSQDAGLLTVPIISKQTAGGRAFSYRAKFLWNGLHIHVRDADSVSTLKSLLKTHFFNRSVGPMIECSLAKLNGKVLEKQTARVPFSPLGFSASDPIMGAESLAY